MARIKVRNMQVNQEGTIASVKVGGELGRRIRDMGLVPGTPIKIQGRAPLFDPVALRVTTQARKAGRLGQAYWISTRNSPTPTTYCPHATTCPYASCGPARRPNFCSPKRLDQKVPRPPCPSGALRFRASRRARKTRASPSDIPRLIRLESLPFRLRPTGHLTSHFAVRTSHYLQAYYSLTST